MKQQQRRRKNPELLKGLVVGLKLNGSLVREIDKDAEAEGLTRSAIIRRVLLDRYRSTLKDAINS